MTIHRAGAGDADAWDAIAREYRPFVSRFLLRRGLSPADTDDLCQDVFARLLNHGVLTRADAARGRFRSLLLTVTTRVIQDHLRHKAREGPVLQSAELAAEPASFDRSWMLWLTERALVRLRREGNSFYQTIADHVAGRGPDRNRLWLARKRLSSLIRDEVAQTCQHPDDIDDELAYLSPYLRPS